MVSDMTGKAALVTGAVAQAQSHPSTRGGNNGRFDRLDHLGSCRGARHVARLDQEALLERRWNQ